MKRFFYSGCSFTSAVYPTWGDIIAYDKLNYKGYDFAYNLATRGGCNQLIASSLACADMKYNFTDQDDIAILWTTLFRESVLTTWFDEPHTKWHAYGNSFNNPVWEEITNQPYLHNLYNMLDRNMTTFHYVNKLYKPFYQGRIGSEGRMKSAMSYKSMKEAEVVKPMDNNFTGQLEEYLAKFWYEYQNLDVFNFDYDGPLSQVSKRFNNHPDILQHLDHAQKVGNLDSRTVVYFKSLSDELISTIQKSINDPNLDEFISRCDVLQDFKNNSGIIWP